MTVLSGLTSFTAGTKAKASEVNGNFTAVKNFVEALSSGVNIDAGAITNAKLASDVYNFYAPIGGIIQYAGSSTPAGGKWLICDGALVSRSTYSALFTAIGTSYGAGDGSTTFALPNLKGKFPLGLDSTQAALDALGETGGSWTIAEGNLPSHTHTFSATTASSTTGISLSTTGSHAHTINGEVATRGLDGPAYDLGALYDDLGNTAYTESTANAGDHTHSVTDSGHTHTLSGTTGNGSGSATAYYQPFVVVNYIIRVA